MSIVFNDDTLAIWYVLLEPAKSDYMGALSRRDYGYMYTWRMRYYKSMDPWDERDEKKWYSMQIPSAANDLDDVIGIIDEMVLSTLALGKAFGKPEPGPVYKLVRGNKTLDEYTKEFMDAPFVHKREATKH